MVILSMEAWEAKQFKTEIYHKLIAAESNPNEESLSREEIFSGIAGQKARPSQRAAKKAPAVHKKKPAPKA
jgi:hypothetical protein